MSEYSNYWFNSYSIAFISKVLAQAVPLKYWINPYSVKITPEVFSAALSFYSVIIWAVILTL